jgi:hypothetical protein
MAYPKISNLNSMLETIGYMIVPLRSQDPIKSEDQA